MKKIYVLGLALIAGTMSFAQSKQALLQKESTAGVKKTTSVKPMLNQNKNTLLWSDDMSDAGTWTLTDENTGGQAAVWEISTTPADIPVDVLSPFASATADNGFFFINSDANNTSDGEGTVINVTAENNTVIDLTGYPSVILEFSHNYRWWHDTRTVSVSGDGGATYTDFIITDQDNYDLGFSTNEQNSGNPQVESIDISTIAGGQSDVKVKFNYNDNDFWAWYWAIDDVSIVEKPENDVQVLYSVVSHNPEDGIEYGRVPTSQLPAAYSFDANVINFGITEQTNVAMTASFTDGTTVIELAQSITSMAQDSIHNFHTEFDETLTVGTYTGEITVVSTEEFDGDNFYNNVSAREFAITEDVYSMDGIGVYATPTVGLMGPGSFLDDSDNPFESGGFLTSYDFIVEEQVYGISMLIGSDEAMVDSEIFVFMADTLDILEDNIDDLLAISEPYTVTAADVAAGMIYIEFDEAFEAEVNTYYAGVFVEEGPDFRVVDDNTVPQPGMASAIFLETTFSNGTAFAIRVHTTDALNPGLFDDVVSLDFTLEQNMPNPATGLTTINYSLTNASKVTLEIVDITGKVVVLLEEGKQAIGNHNIVLDVNNFSAGVYTYTLSVGEQSATKKLIVE